MIAVTNYLSYLLWDLKPWYRQVFLSMQFLSDQSSGSESLWLPFSSWALRVPHCFVFLDFSLTIPWFSDLSQTQEPSFLVFLNWQQTWTKHGDVTFEKENTMSFLPQPIYHPTSWDCWRSEFGIRPSSPIADSYSG